MATIDDIRTYNLCKLIRMNGGVVRFSEKIGKNRTQVSQWMNNSKTAAGKPRYITGKMCRQVEKTLGLPNEWMDTDHDANVSPVETRNFVPLISWVAAGNWTPMANQDNDFHEVVCPFPHGKGTFALQVRGISMENPDGRSFRDGDIIFVDPTREAKHRDLVVVRLDDEAEATFKQLLMEGNQKVLFALNPDWRPRIIPINGNATLIGVVFGRMEGR